MFTFQPTVLLNKLMQAKWKSMLFIFKRNMFLHDFLSAEAFKGHDRVNPKINSRIKG